MALQISTDRVEIGRVLDRVIALDPVRGTLLATIRIGLRATSWACWDGDSVAVRSEAAYPVALSSGWDAALLTELAATLRRVPDLRGVSGPVGVVRQVVGLLGVTPLRRDAMMLYRLDELVPPAVAGAPLLASEVHRQLVRHWFAEFAAEADSIAPRTDAIADGALDGRGCWLWVDADGTPVSVAARRPVIAGSARIGPVYTPPALRGRGYGAAVTAAASRTILDEGGVPVLFTNLANPTSNKIYRQIGYVPVEERLSVVFPDGPAQTSRST